MGSYGFALVLCFFLLLCMFLFVSNVLNLSMEKDLQQYGLLETIGVYPKQIVKIMVRQMAEMVLKGSLVGGLIGSFLVLNILPYILKTRYLERAGEWEGIRLFHPIFSFGRNVARSHYSRNCCFHREAKASIVKSLGMYELRINFFEEKRDFNPIQKTSKLGTLSGNLFGQKISVP